MTAAEWFADRSVEADDAALIEVLDRLRVGDAVPAQLEEQASWALLRTNRDDADRALRICQLRLEQGLPAAVDLEAWALERKLSGENLPPETAGPVARRLLVLCATLRRPAEAGVCDAALGDHPDEATLHGFFTELSGEPGLLESVAAEAFKRNPGSEVSLYFNAQALMQRDRLVEAEVMLAGRPDLLQRCDFLADLHWRCLHGLDRGAELERSVRGFFVGYSGDWWRQPGFREKQARAMRIPPLLVVTQPKSGSLFTLNTLCRALDVPWTYVCPLGLWPYDHFIVRERLADFAEGGAVCVEHLRPTPDMIGELQRAGLRRFMLNLRDVRASALSWVHHLRTDRVAAFSARFRTMADELGPQAGFEAAYLEALAYWAEFQEAWLTHLEAPTFEILVTDFDDLRVDERAYFRTILDFHGIGHEAFDWKVLQTDREERAGHFRSGRTREWEETLSAQTLEQIPAVLERWPRVLRFTQGKDDQAKSNSVSL